MATSHGVHALCDMSWFDAPTPPPTPTERRTRIAAYRKELKSDVLHRERISLSDHMTPAKNAHASSASSPYHSSHSSQHSSHSSHSSKRAPVIRSPVLFHTTKEVPYASEYHSYVPSTTKNHQTALSPNHNAVIEAQPEYETLELPHAQVTLRSASSTQSSSLCQTLYPESAESIKKGIHYTQATGSPFPGGSHFKSASAESMLYFPNTEYSASSHVQPVGTGTLFSGKMSNIDYLSVISDHDSPDLVTQNSQPKTQSSMSMLDYETATSVDTYAHSSVSQHVPITPESIAEALNAFPDTFTKPYASRRKPPPRKQLYNHAHPY